VTQLWPCPRCADGSCVSVILRAQGHNTHFVRCGLCNLRGKDKLTRQAAIVSWNEMVERLARAAEAQARRQWMNGASRLRHDERFVEACVSHFLRVGHLNGEGGPVTQVLKMPIDGIDHEVNTRAFVDGFLVPQWPELAHLVNPESVVHYALADAGLGVRRVTRTGEHAGEAVGKFKRPEPKIGQAITIEFTGEQ
jgi:transcription elongation factor Elf1